MPVGEWKKILLSESLLWTGEEILDQRTINENETVEELFLAPKEGYRFLGWFSGDELYLFGTPVTTDLLLTARWEPYQFTVSFWVDSQEIERLSVEYMGTLDNIPQVPEKAGFDGTWDRTDFTNITEDIKVYALYTLVTYNVAFVADGVTEETTTYTVEDKKITEFLKVLCRLEIKRSQIVQI